MVINSVLFGGATFGILALVTFVGVIIENYGLEESSAEDWN